MLKFLQHLTFSVIGLNFDFLLLNVIGFTCYASYNVLMYFDTYIQVGNSFISYKFQNFHLI